MLYNLKINEKGWEAFFLSVCATVLCYIYIYPLEFYLYVGLNTNPKTKKLDMIYIIYIESFMSLF